MMGEILSVSRILVINPLDLSGHRGRAKSQSVPKRRSPGAIYMTPFANPPLSNQGERSDSVHIIRRVARLNL